LLFFLVEVDIFFQEKNCKKEMKTWNGEVTIGKSGGKELASCMMLPVNWKRQGRLEMRLIFPFSFPPSFFHQHRSLDIAW
jgi:hypothetical protein